MNAKTSNCCAWMQYKRAWGTKVLTAEEHYCGMRKDDFITAILHRPKWLRRENEKFRKECCADQQGFDSNDCDGFIWPAGPAFEYILKLGGSNKFFYKEFLNAWKYATDRGSDVKPLSGTAAAVQLDSSFILDDEFEQEDFDDDVEEDPEEDKFI